MAFKQALVNNRSQVDRNNILRSTIRCNRTVVIFEDTECLAIILHGKNGSSKISENLAIHIG